YFLTTPPPPVSYTLSLHDALPICVNLEPRQAVISDLIGALQPLECLVLLAAPGIHAGGKIGGVLSVLGNELFENSLRRINVPERVFSLGLARQTEGWQCRSTTEGQRPRGLMFQ